jgi:hypothetical protein
MSLTASCQRCGAQSEKVFGKDWEELTEALAKKGWSFTESDTPPEPHTNPLPVAYICPRH